MPDTQSPTPGSLSFSSSISNKSIAAKDDSTAKYVTVVWSMPSWASANNTTQYITEGTASYNQTLVSATNETSITLTAGITIPQDCGTQYQVDSYLDTPAFESFITPYESHQSTLAVGLDNNYLSGNSWFTNYELVHVTDVTAPACVEPCIPDSNVSYYYQSNDANAGYIIVPKNADGSDGTLCTPFYVTATSWTYDSATTWPQTLKFADHVLGQSGNSTSMNNPISASGTYDFAAPVVCGQGDIYAWSAGINVGTPSDYENTVIPEKWGYLTGPENPVPEYFLSEMGFKLISGSYGGSTWIQDNAGCWTAPTPTDSQATCQNPTGNTITVPAVNGGEWTFTPTGGTAVTWDDNTGGTYTATGTATVTVSLADDNPNDAYSIPSTTFPVYTPTDLGPNGLDCDAVTPAPPSANVIQACETLGSITVTPTANVDYYIQQTGSSAAPVEVYAGNTPEDIGALTGLTGSWTVTASAESPYYFDSGTSASWVFDLGTETSCTVTATPGTCTAANGISTSPLYMTFTNNGSTPVSFEVKSDSGNSDASVDYTTPLVDSGTTLGSQLVADSVLSGDLFHVYVGGVAVPADDFTVTFAGCIPTVTPADPTATPATCGAINANNDAYISVDLEPGLIYSITGPNGYSKTDIVLPQNGTPGLQSVASGLSAGTYTVDVAADTADGYVLNPSTSTTYPFTLPIVQPVCDITVTPQDAVCTGALAPATITITPDANVVYTATDNDDSTLAPFVLTDAVTQVPEAGHYTVVVTLSAAGAAANYELPGGVSELTFSDLDLSTVCTLPTLPAWDAGASSTNATCTSTANLDGTITLTHDLDQTGDVTYTVTNDSTHAVVYEGTNTVPGDTVLREAPGQYSVHAVPTNPVDGLSGNTNPDGSEDFTPPAIVQTGIDCNGNLAFTGGTIAWLGFALAGGMLFLGFALLYMRRRGHRAA